MKKKNINIIIGMLSALAVLGLALNVLAAGGQGCPRASQSKCYKEGSGKAAGSGGYCGRYAANLSEEALAQAKTERSAFYEATRDLRQQLHQKDLELRAELAKQAPDAENAAGIQKEISALWAEMDQKHLAHRLRMKAISPELGRGYGYHGFRGHGVKAGGQGRCWE